MSVLHRKAGAGIAAGLTLLTLVTGCGSSPAITDTGTKSTASTKQIELTVQTFPGISAETLANVNTEFTAKHPNVKVTLKDGMGRSPNPTAESLDGIDVVFLNEGQVSQLAGANLLKDLTAVKVPQLNDGVANIFGELGRVNGVRYGLPVSISPAMIMINEQVITRAGIQVPSTDWTWQDFQQALAATKGAGITNQVTLQGIIDPFIRSYGGQLYDADKQQYTFDSPEAKKALQALQPFVKDGLVQTSMSGTIRIESGSTGPGGGAAVNPSAPAFMAFGGVVFMRGGQSQSLPYPKGPNGRPSPATATVAAVSANSANVEMATEYVKALLNDSAEQLALAKGGIRPVTNDAKALAAWQQTVGDQAAKATEAGLPDAYIGTFGATLNKNLIDGLLAYLNGTAALDTTISNLMSTLNK